MPEKSASSKVTTRSDRSICTDYLGMEKRYDGLTKFICSCSTPMTVAIQGDWGSGKTSAMEIIRSKIEQQIEAQSSSSDAPAEKKNFLVRLGEKLKGKDKESESSPRNPHCIWFNTWQFSLFGSGENLTLHLIDSMLDSLREMAQIVGANAELSALEKFQKNITGALKFAGAAVGAGIKSTVPLFDLANNIAEAYKSDSKPEAENGIDIKTLRAQMEELICSILEKTGHDRIYVFIDDLDRLTPRIALELLEGMKNFTDYSRCVFILAVDADVVKMGLRSKYGEDFFRDDDSASKGQSFFDKIIQVPFQLPVSAYDIRKYVQHLRPDDSNNENYIELLMSFNEYNPRTIKRSFNLLELYRCMDDIPDSEMADRYAVLMMQLKTDSEEHSALIANLRGWYNREKYSKIYRHFHDILTQQAGMPICTVIRRFYGSSMEELQQGHELSAEMLEATKKLVKLLLDTNEVMGTQTMSETPSSVKVDSAFAQQLYTFLLDECGAELSGRWNDIINATSKADMTCSAKVGDMLINYTSPRTYTPYITIKNAAPPAEYLRNNPEDFELVDKGNPASGTDIIGYYAPRSSSVSFLLLSVHKFEAFRDMLLQYDEIRKAAGK